MIVCLNGQFLDAKEAKISLFDRGFFYGDGIYETLRTYSGVVWQLDAHLERLAHSARLIGMDVEPFLKKIGADLRETVQRNGFAESRIRLTVSRGVTAFEKPEMTVHSLERPTIAITVTPFTPVDPIFYKEGVSVVTFSAERFLPEAKTLFFLPQLLARQSAHKANAFEALLKTREGHVTEGTISNVFVIHGDTVFTPGTQILFGVTRGFVLDLVRRRYQLVEKSLVAEDFQQATECFLTNTSWEVMPVVRIDGCKIGKGIPGFVTQQIWKDFRAAIVAKHPSFPGSSD